MLVEQVNGYSPILVEREGTLILMSEGTLAGSRREGGRCYAWPDRDRQLLATLFREGHVAYREQKVDTIRSGLPFGVTLIIKGRLNGNMGDWFLTESSWRDRFLEGSGSLDEMANALEQLA